MALPAPSSVQVGEGAAEVAQRAAAASEQSPSLGVQGRQRTRHESWDMAKKVSPMMNVARSKGGSQPSLDKESAGDQQQKQPAAKAKSMGKGSFDAYQGPQEGEQAGPSHGGWPTLQQSAATAGMKCTVAPSQSPKKTAPKVARQIQTQQRIQQQALQPAPACIFLRLHWRVLQNHSK